MSERAGSSVGEKWMRRSSPSVGFFFRIALLYGFGLLGRDVVADRRFEREVAPLLAQRCLSCHQGEESKGGLDLSTQAGALRGGESGPAVVPGKLETSVLWHRVREGEMPPGKGLDPEERRSLKEWIEQGSPWSIDTLDPLVHGGKYRAGSDWWSLQPVRESVVPASNSGWTRNEIDRFVEAKLVSHGLQPAVEAERRVLIRRLSFDLLGLPPSLDEVEAFVQDVRPDAYERLVDRMLASPQYGVRWGRHWLDLARFGESQGFERDKLRENSWPYRDWVVDAFNRDLPYDEFARMQLAGDVLEQGESSGVVATGFLVAGPYDEVGQSQQSAVMKAVVRQDEMEDYVSVVGQTFLGLTVHCARCHDHKFDPIRQSEYYRLAAALDGVSPGSRDVRLEDDLRRLQQIDDELRRTQEQLQSLTTQAMARLMAQRAKGKPSANKETSEDKAATDVTATKDSVNVPLPIARWDFREGLEDRVGAMSGKAQGGAEVRDGLLRLDGKQGHVATAPLGKTIRARTLEAWVQLSKLDQRGGGVMTLQSLDGATFDAIVFGEKDPGQWMAGSNGFTRTKSFGGPPETRAVEEAVHVAITYSEDGTITGYRNGTVYGKPYQSSGPVEFVSEKSQVLFGLRHSPAAAGRMLEGALVTARLYDRALSADEVRRSFEQGTVGVSRDELLNVMTDEERRHWTEWESTVSQLTQRRGELRPLNCYVVKPKAAGRVRLLERGNPATPGAEVLPGGVEAIQGGSADFGLAADASDGDRRRALAKWVTDPENPLFARVMVNRVWQWHFGAGFVATPSDFGFNGGEPSHPELLDWLAREFVRQGYRLKPLHRMIVTSATYRQSSAVRDDAVAKDADNRWLWRFSPRRLEAEEIRDATLSVAGVINLRLGGAGYRDFETYVHNAQFYNMLDPEGPEFERRTLYRTWVRSGRSGLLDAFDCPDPSTMSPERSVTVTPLQALAMQNNSFVLRMSKRFAQRVTETVGESSSEQAKLAFRLTYFRPPTSEEMDFIVPFLREQSLTDLCRVLLNSNEFLHVE
ncbi:MAG: DUF1553 domain-containing protein [Planctomycetaceae bacterium]